MNMMHHALALIDRGFRVLPLAAGGKEPNTRLAPRGAYSASRDKEQVRRWWKESPDANIGLAPDQGLIALDVDPKYGGHLSLVELEIEHGDLPPTLWEWSGGVVHCDHLAADVRGRHIFFQVPDADEGEAPGGNLQGYPGIEARVTGQYVACAPSVHPTGNFYEWAVPLSTEIAIIPNWLLALIPGGRGYRGGDLNIEAIEGVYFDLPEATAARMFQWTWERHQPNRRESLAYYCYRLYHACASPEQAAFYMGQAAMVLQNLSSHQEPYDVDLWIDRKIQQVYRRGRNPKPPGWRMAQILSAEQGVSHER